ncbi:MAG: ATP-binding protein, partial [Prevotella sp.]|nr:ATP-binding protein [Prevotella sp.]
CGVPAEKTEWVFEQFTKIDEFIPGMGMGLTLCRAIVTRLEGLVYIDKEYIGGCKVVIKLPIKQYA